MLKWWELKKAISFKKVNRNGTSSMHNIRCNISLKLGKAAIKHISCACNSFIKQLELPSDKNEKNCNQKRYSVNNSCLYWNIFELLNDWNIIKLGNYFEGSWY